MEGYVQMKLSKEFSSSFYLFHRLSETFYYFGHVLNMYLDAEQAQEKEELA